MAVVTKVTKTRAPGRYNIYLDDEFSFAVDEKILIKYDLFKDNVFDDAAIADIKKAEFEQKAYQIALVYATGKMRSKGQVILKLKEKEVPNDVIATVITRLENTNVLDDALFVEEYIRSAISSGKLGPKGVKYKLQQLGVDKFAVEDGLELYTEDDQIEILERRVASLIEKNGRQAKFMAEQKTTQKLLQDGFDQRLIKRAIQAYNAENEADPEQEWDNLVNEAEKLAAKYADYAGWEFKNKLKAGMFRKGFDLGMVDRWLRENGH
ncbi:MAG: RecX family transcriptional regulator [Lactobacillaceae bacterium]|jgi:regulatory protein|nr:RecX family transcriptional regulator [Lactobacillaceae bacterium]